MKENPNFFLTAVFSAVLIILFINVFPIPVLLMSQLVLLQKVARVLVGVL
jgi:hypothetical protein